MDGSQGKIRQNYENRYKTVKAVFKDGLRPFLMCAPRAHTLKTNEKVFFHFSTNLI